MELKIRALTPEERRYTYTPSPQIAWHTGCIGHLRAELDDLGEAFYSRWDDHAAAQTQKTQEFKDEFDDVINALRQDESYGYMLSNRTRLRSHCYSHMEESFGNDREWGIRVETDKYAYLMKLNPHKGEYAVYCYCYVKDWLDKHIQNASKGIRFITSDYKEKFRIADGDKIRITEPNGKFEDKYVYYIDDYHIEVSEGFYNNTFHICEFAERLENSASTVIPLRSSLPDRCYSVLKSSGDIIMLKKGESGYFNTDFPKMEVNEAERFAAKENEKLGVSKAQAEAMSAGAMFGWDCKAADPASYDNDGKPIAIGRKERSEER